ncbi:MAG: hypothetical protein WC575_02235 [Patescibacteria group bacterium]
MYGFNKRELAIFRKLTSPVKIQDYLETIPINFEKKGETCMSPRLVLREYKAHCIEGAMLAAVALRFLGYKPLVLDLTVSVQDDDHVITVFKRNGLWGAISKINHYGLRYRDPVFRDIRELVMSYFNEYFIEDGRKILRSYSLPVDLSRFDKRGWMTSEKDVWYIVGYLDQVRHYQVATKTVIKKLRSADKLEIKASSLVQWPPKK